MFELGIFIFGFIFAGLILEWCGIKMWVEEESITLHDEANNMDNMQPNQMPKPNIDHKAICYDDEGSLDCACELREQIEASKQHFQNMTEVFKR